MKKNLTMAVMVIVLLLQYLGLFPAVTNKQLADFIYESATGKEPVQSKTIGE